MYLPVQAPSTKSLVCFCCQELRWCGNLVLVAKAFLLESYPSSACMRCLWRVYYTNSHFLCATRTLACTLHKLICVTRRKLRSPGTATEVNSTTKPRGATLNPNLELRQTASLTHQTHPSPAAGLHCKIRIGSCASWSSTWASGVRMQSMPLSRTTGTTHVQSTGTSVTKGDVATTCTPRQVWESATCTQLIRRLAAQANHSNLSSGETAVYVAQWVELAATW